MTELMSDLFDPSCRMIVYMDNPLHIGASSLIREIMHMPGARLCKARGMITLGNGAVVYILYHESNPYRVMGIRITDMCVDGLAARSSWNIGSTH